LINAQNINQTFRRNVIFQLFMLDAYKDTGEKPPWEDNSVVDILGGEIY